MEDPRKTNTLAGDSAPGVDDARRFERPPAPPVNAKPAGRGLALGFLAFAVLLLAAAFIFRPERGDEGDMVSFGYSEGEIAAGGGPGTSDGSAPAAQAPR